jgi:hypothetical protein
MVTEHVVLISPDGFGRIAIVRCGDGDFCLYEHWRGRGQHHCAFPRHSIVDERWAERPYDRPALYHDAEPLPGRYRTASEATQAARTRPGFAYAQPEAP